MVGIIQLHLTILEARFDRLDLECRVDEAARCREGILGVLQMVSDLETMDSEEEGNVHQEWDLGLTMASEISMDQQWLPRWALQVRIGLMAIKGYTHYRESQFK